MPKKMKIVLLLTDVAQTLRGAISSTSVRVPATFKTSEMVT